MLVFDFKNYEEFKERFGVRECGNGNKSRQNKILLAYIKQHSLIKGALAGDLKSIERLRTPDMSTLLLNLKSDLFWETRRELRNRGVLYDCYNLAGWEMCSSKYSLDGQEGVCEDKDYRSVRYINNESHRVFKMKAGKFLKSIIDETEWGRNLPEAVRLWFFEEFTQAWETHTRSIVPEYTLVVNDDFESIYNPCKTVGNFGSCMAGNGYWTFYRDYVKAKAASLVNQEGRIIARCIVFTEVFVDDGKGTVLRLAERQYCTDGEEVLKRCLVDALIAAGEIDGYKKVGASCHDGHSFVLNDGTSLGSYDMCIECTAGNGDRVSYMDSFKYLNIDDQEAHNSDYVYYDADLATTSGTVETNENYDSYHDYYTHNEVVTVYYDGREYTCDEDYLEDFTYVNGDYYHNDDVYTCPRCGSLFVPEDGCYSELTDEDYCCDRCCCAAEDEWKEQNWEYSSFDDDYYETVETFINSEGDEMTICARSLMRLRDRGRVWYDEEKGMWSAVVRETENEEA